MITTISGDPEKSSAEVGPSAQKMSDPTPTSDTKTRAPTPLRRPSPRDRPSRCHHCADHKKPVGGTDSGPAAGVAEVGATSRGSAIVRLPQHGRAAASERRPRVSKNLTLNILETGRGGSLSASRPGSRSRAARASRTSSPAALARPGADSYTQTGSHTSWAAATSVSPLTPVTSICTGQVAVEVRAARGAPKPPR